MVHGFVKLALIAAGGIVAATPSVAADLARGAQLAQQRCANCHPSFRAIAQRGLTRTQLRVFLVTHGAMPDRSLSRAEIDDLIAYIETFR